MIKYALICSQGHGFEGWFGDSKDFEGQKSRGLLTCPICGDGDISKAIMAPNVKKSTEDLASSSVMNSQMQAAYKKIREEISKNFQYVGDNFADEARAIHYGEKEQKPIYGQTTPPVAQELLEEGIAIAPIPPLANPKLTKDLN